MGFVTAGVTLPFVNYVGGGDRGFGFQMFTLVPIAFFIVSTIITCAMCMKSFRQTINRLAEGSHLTLKAIVALYL